jgi:hypothetical protein
MSFQADLLYADAGGSLDEHSVVAGCSWGNDSIALVQWCREQGLEDVTCLYNDTGWSWPATGNHEAWIDRVERLEAWALAVGYKVARTRSMGMEALVHWKGGWPRQGMQFCTEHLKVGPTIAWLAEHDPRGLALCMNGKRRAESTVRSLTPEWIDVSVPHGGRRLQQPLYAHADEQRDALIRRAGHEPLPHKSRECKCINANALDLQQWPEPVVADVERVETDLGHTAKGAPKTMFRPARKLGATGIREVIRWSKAGRGKYRPVDDGTGPSETETGCDGGFCAS